MAAFLSSLLFVFIAEMGDKSQLLSMAFASKYKTKDVFIGVATAILALNALAVGVGSYLSNLIPINIIKVVAAISFLIFGIWTLKSIGEDEEEESERKSKFGPIITIFITFFISEFGDKTQLMAITMAAQTKNPIAIFLGSVLGMLFADGIGIIGGSYLVKFIPKVFVQIGAAMIFLVFGTLTLYKGVFSINPSLVTLPTIFVFLIILLVLIYFVSFKLKTQEK